MSTYDDAVRGTTLMSWLRTPSHSPRGGAQQQCSYIWKGVIASSDLTSPFDVMPTTQPFVQV